MTMEELDDSGALASAKRIDSLQRESAARSDVLPLAGGLPAQELFPRRAIAAASVDVLGGSDASALQYGWPEGAPELRSWIARRLIARGADVTADDVIITSGAQQAIALAVDTLLRPGDKVAVDAESYPSALDLFRSRGLKLTTELDARAAYLMPGVGNPRGVGIGELALQRWLETELPLIADEAYAELRFDGQPAPLLLRRATDRVFHIGTFSKTVCPGLRIGWLVPPPPLRERVLQLKADADLQANSLSQAILARTLETWDYDAHLTRVRAEYARRAERLFSSVRRQLPFLRVEAAEGGFSLFAQSDHPGDDAALLALAVEEGVSFDPGRRFRYDDAAAPLAFRLCYSNLRLGRIDEAVRRFARAWRRFTH